MTTPGRILNIGFRSGQNRFNVGIGYPDGHKDFGIAGIAGGWKSDPEFVATLTGVRFRVSMNGGRTSSGTKYPRSELREFALDGVTRAAWDGREGTHWMEGESRVTHLPPKKPWVCFTQVHDAESDLIRVQTEGTSPSTLKLVARNTPPGGGDEQAVTVQSTYRLGDWVKWRIEVTGGAGQLFLGGQVVRDFPANTDGCYFKAGAYAQTNTKDVGESPSEYVEVELRNLRHWHIGWPAVPVPDPSPHPVSDVELWFWMKRWAASRGLT